MPNAMHSYSGSAHESRPTHISQAPASTKPLTRDSVATRCRRAARMTRRNPSAHFDNGRDMEAP
jgi:hypothetical protein